MAGLCNIDQHFRRLVSRVERLCYHHNKVCSHLAVCTKFVSMERQFFRWNKVCNDGIKNVISCAGSVSATKNPPSLAGCSGISDALCLERNASDRLPFLEYFALSRYPVSQVGGRHNERFNTENHRGV